MCTNYVAPGEDPGLSELKIDSFRDLYRWTPWKPEISQDYDAPIVGYVDGQFKPLIAGFGFWPRALQKANVEKAKAAGRKPPLMRTTMNVRDDNLGTSPLYGPTWRAGRRCLIPARFVVEPYYPRARQEANGDWVLGPCVWQRIGVADRPTMCVAGIWRTLTNQDGAEHHVMSMITVNADGHPLMARMHKPADEKRSVVILRPDDWEEWLTTSNIEAARAMLQLYPAEDMAAEPATVNESE
ncbi:SOS response-associated peptidase family protein [Burkholderia anthinoferrum]|uniref:SOS response-associated peptidase family protein n=1 Tax=Burkholderia anthinoferrum TaxID=3090833 RepID=UPI002B2529F2|nr:SOS response-associated peptidase family protein [Burkholderia anthinoferrum]MEB2530328.1 SOS response-associated peptidase family protein [Burkholderia anthinoferrum]MEB2561701.1 SOS response-associated peptidase family protein [Burkholderia anthinoferrum]